MRGAGGLGFVAVALAAAALALDSASAPSRPTTSLVSSDDETFTISSSAGGSAIFSADNLAPGHTTGGSVTVGNGGSLPGTFTLSQHDLTDEPGPGGGRLSARLHLAVTEVTVPSAPVTVYAGPLRSLDSRPLGYFGPGQARIYSFTAGLPDEDGATDNSFSGSAATVRYTWTGTSLPAGTPPPADLPTAAPADAPVDAAPLDAPADEAAQDAATVPAGGATSAVPLRLRLRVPPHQALLGRGALTAYVRCDRPCRVSVWAWVDDPLGPGRFLRGRRRLPLASGQRTRLVLRLPWAPRDLLARAPGAGRPARVHVHARAAGSAGEQVGVERVVAVGERPRAVAGYSRPSSQATP